MGKWRSLINSLLLLRKCLLKSMILITEIVDQTFGYRASDRCCKIAEQLTS